MLAIMYKTLETKAIRHLPAEEVHVAIGVIQSGDGGPELLLLQPRQRVCGGFASVATVPLANNEVFHRVRRHLECVTLSRLLARLDGSDLLADGNESVAEAVKLGLALRLRRLDHESVGYGPAHGRGVEAVVLQTLGNVDDLDAGRLLELASVEDELVCAAAVLVGVEDFVVGLQAGENVVCIE